MNNNKIDTCKILSKSFKYTTLGMSVALVTIYVTNNKIPLENILIIAATSSLVYSLIDTFGA